MSWSFAFRILGGGAGWRGWARRKRRGEEGDWGEGERRCLIGVVES